jgi:hypothetical protein
MLKAKTKPQRRWGDALSKVNREGRCRVCGERRDLEAAHIIGREHDALLSGPRGGQYYYVHPDSIVPLCGAFTDNFCHGIYDAHNLDLLPFLTQDEQERAVHEARGVISMLKRVSPMGGTW